VQVIVLQKLIQVLQLQTSPCIIFVWLLLHFLILKVSSQVPSFLLFLFSASSTLFSRLLAEFILQQQLALDLDFHCPLLFSSSLHSLLQQ
jgi:hypothetical protein